MEDRRETEQGDARQGRWRGRAGPNGASSPAASGPAWRSSGAELQFISILRTALLLCPSRHLCASLPSHLRTAQPCGFFPCHGAPGVQDGQSLRGEPGWVMPWARERCRA